MTKVYRLEKNFYKNGELLSTGPFLAPFILDDEFELEINAADIFNTINVTLPEPEEDGIFGYGNEHLFGCSDPLMIIDWFPFEHLDNLINSGFELNEYEADVDFVGFFQCAWKKENAVKTKTFISKKDFKNQLNLNIVA